MTHQKTGRALARGTTFAPRTLAQIGERDACDARFRAAFLATIRTLPAAPHPAWRWHDVARGKYHPMRVAVEMLDAAIDAGAREDDVWGVVTTLTDHVERRFPRRVLSLVEASQQETEAECAVNPVQLSATVAPSLGSLALAEERIATHDRMLDRLLAAIRAKRRELEAATLARMWQ